MKKVIATLLLAAAVGTGAGAQTPYVSFFTDRTLRVDYYHTGTKGSESFSVDQAIDDGPWAGSKLNLVDTLNLGEFTFRVYDLATGQLIFSRGFSSMFNEWQTTDEAARGVYRTFSESARMPFPRRPIQLTVARRDKRMIFHELFSTTVDPADPTQVRKEKKTSPYKVGKLFENGPSAEKVDIVILGDGYAKADMEKFRADAKKFNDAMFSTSPFKARKDDFNVWTVEVESGESGIDIPDKNVWKNNALGTMYNTFGSARYVLTTDNKALRDAAAAAPYDFICILTNDSRYGGGGIYNLYATTYTGETTKGQEWQMEYVYVHEFGHSFGGLGDEYYSSDVAYDEFYPQGVEPWEPNLTVLLDKKNVKWKSHLTQGIEVPTPWEKPEYDSLETQRAKLDRLAPDYYQKREPLYRRSMEILKTSKSAGKVGVFEGAGYASKGIYRPAVDCRMFTLSLVEFDPVCSTAIERVVDFYSK
jgi:hypothetical protein